jgi:precorrin-2 dehydrogenase
VPDYFPTFLDLRNRRCLVVGGGLIAERKAQSLLSCGARVRLVSPVITPALRALAETGAIEHRARRFRRVDVGGCVLAVAATGIAEIDDAVVAECRRRRALVNVVDRPAVCDFIYGSVLRRGELQVAVSTGGRAPALAREVRRRLEGVVGEDYAALVEDAARARQAARAAAATPAARLAAGERVVMRVLEATRAAPLARSPGARD